VFFVFFRTVQELHNWTYQSITSFRLSVPTARVVPHVGACMRKLVMVAYGVLKNRAPFNPRVVLKQDPLTTCHLVRPCYLSVHCFRTRIRLSGSQSVNRTNSSVSRSGSWGSALVYSPSARKWMRTQ
jgi:hypothetical protein